MSFSKSWVSFSACAAFLGFVYFAVAPQFFNIPAIAFHSSEIAHARKIQATKHNVWTDLTPSEADDVVKFLLSRADLNLTEAAKATRYFISRVLVICIDRCLAKIIL